jgi:hypothetical protein
MRDERFEVTVTFDERRGYVATARELRQPVTALSLGGLRRRIEALLLPDSVNVRLMLDCSASVPDQCLHSAEADVRPPRRKSGFDPYFAVMHKSVLVQRCGNLRPSA